MFGPGPGAGAPGSPDLKLRNQSSRLQVERVFVEAQASLHHLLVVKLKVNVAARRNVDLRPEGLHVLRVGSGGNTRPSEKVLRGGKVPEGSRWFRT